MDRAKQAKKLADAAEVAHQLAAEDKTPFSYDFLRVLGADLDEVARYLNSEQPQ